MKNYLYAFDIEATKSPWRIDYDTSLYIQLCLFYCTNLVWPWGKMVYIEEESAEISESAFEAFLCFFIHSKTPRDKKNFTKFAAFDYICFSCCIYCDTLVKKDLEINFPKILTKSGNNLNVGWFQITNKPRMVTLSYWLKILNTQNWLWCLKRLEFRFSSGVNIKKKA